MLGRVTWHHAGTGTGGRAAARTGGGTGYGAACTVVIVIAVALPGGTRAGYDEGAWQRSEEQTSYLHT